MSAGTTPDPTMGQGGGAIYAASFNALNITSSVFTQNTASRVNITDFKAGRGAGGAISINSDALITSTCSAGLVSITGNRSFIHETEVALTVTAYQLTSLGPVACV